MLEYLKLSNVGPSPKMQIEFKPRMNFLTGDNGLGKTFLLDIAWWVLTRTWARSPATPPRRSWKTPEGTARGTSSIEYGYEKSSGGVFRNESIFNRAEQYWPLKPGRPPIAGMVIYAQVDGGFSAWDPAAIIGKTRILRYKTTRFPIQAGRGLGWTAARQPRKALQWLDTRLGELAARERRRLQPVNPGAAGNEPFFHGVAKPRQIDEDRFGGYARSAHSNASLQTGGAARRGISRNEADCRISLFIGLDLARASKSLRDPRDEARQRNRLPHRRDRGPSPSPVAAPDCEGAAGCHEGPDGNSRRLGATDCHYALTARPRLTRARIRQPEGCRVGARLGE